MAKPTPRLFILSIFLLIFIFSWILFQEQILLKIWISLLIIIISSYAIVRIQLLGLFIEFFQNKLKADVGSIIDIRFEVSNKSKFAKNWVEVVHDGGLSPESTTNVITALKPNNVYINYSRLFAIKRGIYNFGNLLIKTEDPIGLFKLERQFGNGKEIVIFPKIFLIKNDLGYALQSNGSKTVHLKSQTITTNASGVSEYIPGDSLNKVHWPISAKRGKLTVKEFDQESLSLIWVIADSKKGIHIHEDKDSQAFLDIKSNPKITKKGYNLPRDSYEYTLSIAASLTSYNLKRKIAVGFLSEGDQFVNIQPDPGMRQLEKILVSISRLKDSGKNGIFDILNRQSKNFRSGCIIFLITPEFDSISRIIHNYQSYKRIKVIPILINRESFKLTNNPYSSINYFEIEKDFVVNYQDNIPTLLERIMHIEHEVLHR